jgi:hypothetical protein
MQRAYMGTWNFSLFKLNAICTHSKGTMTGQLKRKQKTLKLV